MIESSQLPECPVCHEILKLDLDNVLEVFSSLEKLEFKPLETNIKCSCKTSFKVLIFKNNGLEYKLIPQENVNVI